MWLDLQKMRIDHPRPDGLCVEMVQKATDWDVDNLPYYVEKTEPIRFATTRLRPQRVWHFAAWLDSKPVGHSTLCLTTGALGIAGIYDIGVVPEARNQGVGKAVTIAACSHGQKIGCRHATLNGTGERMYRQIGFERIGYGMTWWLNVARLEANPPTPTRIAFAEAIGRGDIDALDGLEKQVETDGFDVPLTNGMMPMELAVKLGKTTLAQWLVDHGVTLDVLSAWDFGWKDRVADLLAKNPELVNRRSGEMQTTPLHVAAERDDIELARLLLTANPDLDIKDATFGGTPLGWAHNFQRTDIIELIEAHQACKSKI
jgi:GNAT superfamily N-acetyltransferase